MKYGQELQKNIFAPWRLSYIAYDALKQELKFRQLDHGWTEKDEQDFVGLLDNELTKVYDFINAKLAEIDARILYCERTIQTLKNNPNMASDSNYAIMDEALTEILFDINDLSRFTRVNFTAIQKILKKHDKWTGRSLKQEYVQKLRDKPLDKQRFDIAIVYISALHDICRNRGHQSQGNAQSGGDQNAFERATSKYWIHPDNITEVKAIIMLHLPVLIFNKEKQWEPSDSAISSVYLDNSNFDLYTGRLQRDDGAEAIRLRWYGPMNTPHVYVERKTHHAPWLNGMSVKDRFRLKENDVNDFLSSKHTVNQIVHDLRQAQSSGDTVNQVKFISEGVQTSVRDKDLHPMLRVYYNRTAFQLPDDQRLRISLDSNLTFIREDHLDGEQRRKPLNWRRNEVGIDYPFPYLKEADILRFPYAVLETKLQTHLGQEPPQWLMSLVESHLVHEVPRFSKYLHGASHFYRERLPLLPWWLAELNVDIRKPRAENTGLTRSKSFKPLIDGRYRRAMIEERERYNQQAVVLSSHRDTPPSVSPSATAASTATTPHATPLKFSTGSPPLLSDHAIPISAVVPPSPPEKTASPPANLRTSLPPRLSRMMDQSHVLMGKIRTSFQGFSKGDEEMRVDVDSPVGKNGRPKVRVRVEPKVFFANERTFISWLQFCALLLTVALNLLNFGDHISRAVGGVFMGLAAGIAIYALYRFEKRAWMIHRRIDGRYDDIYGPMVLCLVLVIALIVNFYLRFK